MSKKEERKRKVHSIDNLENKLYSAKKVKG